MEIALVRNIAINGEHHNKGETLSVSDELGQSLVAMQRAVPTVPKKITSKKSAIVETAAVVAGNEQSVIPDGEIKG